MGGGQTLRKEGHLHQRQGRLHEREDHGRPVRGREAPPRPVCRQRAPSGPRTVVNRSKHISRTESAQRAALQPTGSCRRWRRWPSVTPPAVFFLSTLTHSIIEKLKALIN